MSTTISSGGLGAVLSTLKHVSKQTGIIRGSRALVVMNNMKGFDCPGCAWPEPSSRSSLEFCENGAKALMSATTKRVIDENFLANNSIDALNTLSDHALEEQGRLITPMIKRPNAKHFETISYEEAFELAARHFTKLKNPHEAIFYTSGRATNETAFLYQLFARLLGTNNLCDCSNLCHESSGVALKKTIGCGKGTVQISDFLEAQVIFLIGHNPSTNHPRMLSTLQEAKERGALIVVINPMLEPGLKHFRHPQKLKDWIGKPFELATHYFQVKVGQDTALFYTILQRLLNDKAALDHSFITSHTAGFLELRNALNDQWPSENTSGLRPEEISLLYKLITKHERIIYAWGMGITQTTDAVATIEAIASIALSRGHIGKPGAGLCPVRGHSNVQGNRTVGIIHNPNDAFSERLGQRFLFEAPTSAGLDVVDSIKAMSSGAVKIFVALGGNFLSASPDYDATREALNRCDLRISLSTKLNRTHLLKEQSSLILPCLTRVEKDYQNGVEQIASVENSMSIVHKSRGHFAPIRAGIMSEPAIIASLAAKVLPNSAFCWQTLGSRYELIREHIGAVIPELAGYNERLNQAGGFLLPNDAHSRIFNTPSKKAQFMQFRPPSEIKGNYDLMLTTIRSHDQFNTAIYGLDDRYRGISGQRDIVFINAADIKRLNLKHNMRVDLVSFFDGQERRLKNIQIKAHDIKEGSAACYFPEANVLIPLSSVAHESNTPTSKQVPICVATLPMT